MAQKIRLDAKYLKGFVTDKDLKKIYPEVKKAHELLSSRKGPGKEFLGWMDLPLNISERLIGDIQKTANRLDSISDAVVIIGIGGSYLGSRAVIEAISPETVGKKILFAGHHLCGRYLRRLLDELKHKAFSIVVVSKSGTTTEPAVSFRIIEDLLKKKYSLSKVRERVVCITDKEKGSLKHLAYKNKYKTFAIPDDVGGRFSSLSPAGLFPIACAKIDISRIISGALFQRGYTLKCGLDDNASYKYAAIRNILYRKGERIEILSNFDARLHYTSEWWKQLFSESEGKDGRNIFPSICDFTTDLHSMGQLIQEGERNIFETFLVAEKETRGCRIPKKIENLDNLNYLAGKEVDYINEKAYEATRQAHFEGGVPNTTIILDDLSSFSLGQVFYFFEKAVAISGYLSGVNPFDQPGVDAYKKKMFKLLGKPH